MVGIPFGSGPAWRPEYPDLHVMLNEGYFDLVPSGHMIDVHVPALKELHDNVATFVRRTEGPAPATQ